MSQPQLVFAETSPYNSVEAIIEQDDQVACFYLRGIDQQRFPMKSCWIRNLVDAPQELDRSRLAQGLPPTLPAGFCRDARAQQPLEEHRLRVVWWEPGDGAALLEDDQLLAVIPPWSGSEKFDGLARECQVASPLCGLLPNESHPLWQQIAAADRFWKSWQSDTSPWLEYEPKLLAAYEQVFGEPANYYAIDGGDWPPRTLARYHWQGWIVLLTVGVSLCPQPGLERVFENPGMFRRLEWGACFEEAIEPVFLEAFIRYLSGQVSLPWNQLTFLADGHSIGCELFLKSDGMPDFSSILLCGQRRLPQDQGLELPTVLGDPVNLLWTVPVFENERKFIQETNNFSVLGDLLSQDPFPVIRQRRTLV